MPTNDVLVDLFRKCAMSDVESVLAMDDIDHVTALRIMEILAIKAKPVILNHLLSFVKLDTHVASRLERCVAHANDVFFTRNVHKFIGRFSLAFTMRCIKSRLPIADVVLELIGDIDDMDLGILIDAVCCSGNAEFLECLGRKFGKRLVFDDKYIFYTLCSCDDSFFDMVCDVFFGGNRTVFLKKIVNMSDDVKRDIRILLKSIRHELPNKLRDSIKNIK